MNSAMHTGAMHWGSPGRPLKCIAGPHSPTDRGTPGPLDPGALQSRLRGAGVALFVCNESGELRLDDRQLPIANCQLPNGSYPPAHLTSDLIGNWQAPLTSGPETSSPDWLIDLLSVAPLFQRALLQAAEGWAAEAEPQPVEAIPGLWLAPMPMLNRRRRVGYAVAALPTARLLQAEQLHALCQAARFDFTLCASRLRALPPVAESEIPRLTALVRVAHEDHVRLATSDHAMESVGRQLGESYEEMNLLYTIIQNMTVKERTERFVLAACRELLNTLPYAWIGAMFIDDRDRLKGLAGQLLTAGNDEVARSYTGERRAGDDVQPRPHSVSAAPVSALRDAARGVLALVQSDAAMVLEPRTNPAHAGFAALGGMALVQPLSGGSEGAPRRLMGVLIAADKCGEDTAASSVDMKLLSATASHMAIFLENAALYDDLNAMFLGTLEALTASIDAKDRYTCGHSRRVAHLTQQLAQAIGLDDQTVDRMHIAGLVHDVGKIGVPEEVLLKPGKLTEAEFDWIRRHPEMGYRILKDIPQLHDVLPGVLHHHERWDGRGYPQNLAGATIPLVARLICLADSFDAMSSTRTYRSALSRPQVLEEILRCAGAQFDPELARVFVNLDFRHFDRLVREHQAQDTRERESATVRSLDPSSGREAA